MFYTEWCSETSKIAPAWIPPFSDFTTKHKGLNEDALLAGKVYVAPSQKIGELVERIKDPDRKLPIILVSWSRESNGYLLGDIAELAYETLGLATVIRLADDKGLLQLRPHGCYGGAVRIYYPGFQESDHRDNHPYWHPDDLGVKSEITVRSEILVRIIIWSQGVIKPEELKDIERRKDQEIGNQARSLQEQVAKKDVELSRADKDYTELLLLNEKLAACRRGNLDGVILDNMP